MSEEFRPYSKLKEINDALAAILERDHFGVQYCIVLVGERGDGRSDTSLVSNIVKDQLREHFLKVLDDPSYIETEPEN
jgi:hypothetical protein